MTEDDALRQACMVLWDELATDSYMDRIVRLERFAKAERAAVWEEAAQHTLEYNCDHNHGKKATKACDELEEHFRQHAKDLQEQQEGPPRGC